MYKCILLPTDGSDLSMRAISHGVRLAKSLNAKLIGLTVTRPWHLVTADPAELTDTEETYQKHVNAIATERLSAIEKAAAEAAVPCEVVHSSRDHPYEAIIETARDKGCDLILMASHGRSGVKALVLGSETHKVLTYSSIPVLVHH